MDKIVGAKTPLGLTKWEDCDVQEKLERLRREVDGWRRICDQMRSTLELYDQHSHAEGKVVVGLKESDASFRMMQCASSINYL